MKKKTKLSRREMLIALGILSAGGAVCACSGITALGLLLAQKNDSTISTPVTITQLIETPQVHYSQPAMISRDEWGAHPPNHEAENEHGFFSEDNLEGWRVYEDELNESYQTVLIHHSAFYEQDDLSTLLKVQSTHRVTRGWADVAYHFIIGLSGTIYEGRDTHVRGTHVEGFNTGTLGICLLGNFQYQSPTAHQLASAQQLINWASERLELGYIATHRHFNPLTECPGDNLFPYIEQFAAVANLQIGIDGYIAPESAMFCPCCSCDSTT